jgi:transposase IS116/IS110/IS902 family protein
VLRGIPNDRFVRVVIESLLSTWRHLSTELKKLNREIERAARAIPVCRRLMTVPGVGSLTAVAYATTVDEPSRFRRSKDLGPYLGLTPRKYQSGEVDRAGAISKCGERMTRSLLFEAAGVLLFRNRQTSALKEWGLNLFRRAGTRKARVAVARVVWIASPQPLAIRLRQSSRCIHQRRLCSHQTRSRSYYHQVGLCLSTAMQADGQLPL